MEERDKLGRFRPGHKVSVGNRGKSVHVPPKVRDFTSTFNAAVSQEDRALFVAEQFRLARSGDHPDLAKLFLDKCLPPIKPVSLPVKLDVDDARDPVAVCGAALEAVADGRLDATSAGDLLKAVESLVQVVTAIQLGGQLESMQAQLTQLIEARAPGRRGV